MALYVRYTFWYISLPQDASRVNLTRNTRQGLQNLRQAIDYYETKNFKLNIRTSKTRKCHRNQGEGTI